jgi:hypothetical protein
MHYFAISNKRYFAERSQSKFVAVPEAEFLLPVLCRDGRAKALRFSRMGGALQGKDVRPIIH